MNTETKYKPRSTCKFKNCSHECTYHCAQQSYNTTQHRTVLIHFSITSRQQEEADKG